MNVLWLTIDMIALQYVETGRLCLMKTVMMDRMMALAVILTASQVGIRIFFVLEETGLLLQFAKNVEMENLMTMRSVMTETC